MRQPEEEPSHICTDDWCLYQCDICGKTMCLENEKFVDPLGNKICEECNVDNS